MESQCQDCKRQRSAAWCEICDIENLKENFRNWTSGNSKIDEFIRYTQLNANENMDYLEWIDFDQFDLIENINKRGALSSIYSTVWTEGPLWNLDEEAEVWNRNLYSYLEESMGTIYWRDIVDMLWSVSMGLNFIHEHDLIHEHLHGGNVLIESEMDYIDAKIEILTRTC